MKRNTSIILPNKIHPTHIDFSMFCRYQKQIEEETRDEPNVFKERH